MPNTPDDNKGDGQSEDPDDYMLEVEHVTSEKDLFWVSEEGTRLRTSMMSPYERHQLSYHAWQSDWDRNNVKTVVQHFGQQRGATRNCKLLMEVLSKEAGYQAGQVVDLRGPAFSLCKHLHLALIRALPEQLPVAAGSGDEEQVTCFCFPKSALMLEGCFHKKQPLYKMDHFWKTLCPTCTTCMRCGGHLGFTF